MGQLGAHQELHCRGRCAGVWMCAGEQMSKLLSHSVGGAAGENAKTPIHLGFPGCGRVLHSARAPVLPSPSSLGVAPSHGPAHLRAEQSEWGSRFVTELSPHQGLWSRSPLVRCPANTAAPPALIGPPADSPLSVLGPPGAAVEAAHRGPSMHRAAFSGCSQQGHRDPGPPLEEGWCAQSRCGGPLPRKRKLAFTGGFQPESPRGGQRVRQKLPPGAADIRSPAPAGPVGDTARLPKVAGGEGLLQGPDPAPQCTGQEAAASPLAQGRDPKTEGWQLSLLAS